MYLPIQPVIPYERFDPLGLTRSFAQATRLSKLEPNPLPNKLLGLDSRLQLESWLRMGSVAAQVLRARLSGARPLRRTSPNLPWRLAFRFFLCLLGLKCCGLGCHRVLHP